MRTALKVIAAILFFLSIFVVVFSLLLLKMSTVQESSEYLTGLASGLGVLLMSGAVWLLADIAESLSFLKSTALNFAPRKATEPVDETVTT